MTELSKCPFCGGDVCHESDAPACEMYDGYEEGDNDTVSILIVAAHYTTTAINGKIEIGLVELSQMVRDTIATMLVEEHDGFQIDDYSLTVGPTQMDVQKPCYFHEFTYQTNTQNTDQS